MPIEPRDKPDATSKAYEAQKPALDIVRDVYGGTLRMREMKKKYLPQFPKETDGGYNARVSTAVLYNATRRTVRGLVGMVMRKPPTLSEDVPEEIENDAENIDLEGRSLAAFARDTLENAGLDGHTHIFVDMQRAELGPGATLDDERRLGLRPYWINILKSDLLRFRTVKIRGVTMLAEFAYRTTTPERDGKYGEKTVTRVRIYQLVGVAEGGQVSRFGVQFEVWRQNPDATKEEDEWQLETPPTLMRGISRIPLATAYANRTGYMMSEPPLLDLAFENILHFQTRSDRHNTLHIAGVPIPIFVGLDEDTAAVGSDLGIKLPIGGDAKYLEPTGASLEASRSELKDIEARMAALGMTFLQPETRSAETATAHRIDKSETDSSLSTWVTGLETALNECLSFHAEWRGVEDGGSVEVNRDFENMMLDPSVIRELREMVRSGDLSVDTLWDILQRWEILPDTFDPDGEKDRIAERMLSEVAKIAKQIDASRKAKPEPAAA